MNHYNSINSLKLPKLINRRFRIINNKSIIPKNQYFLNALKNEKMKRTNSENSDNKKNELNIKNMIILNMSPKRKKEKKEMKNTSCSDILSSFSFKNIFNTLKKNKIKKSFSTLNVNTIEKERPNLESNFKKLINESNIYTSKANYITNKKMIIIDKYLYDNNYYKPDRLGLYDMSNFKRPKMTSGNKIIGKIYYNHNKYQINKEDFLNNI